MTADLEGGSAAAGLRRLLSRDEPLIVPGVHDPLTAAAAEVAGFDAVYYGGLMTALQLRNWESVLTMPDAVESARRIADVVSVPLIVDAEGGFGGAIQVTRTTQALESVGVAAFHIEDSLFPRAASGHAMVSPAEMQHRIRAALDARTDLCTVVIARTEAYAVTAGDVDETMRRLDAYREAGADFLMPMVFARDDAVRVAEEFRSETLIYLALTRRSHEAEMSPEEIRAMGYQVVLYPILTMSASFLGVREALRQLHDARKSGLDQAALVDVWNDLDNVVLTRAGLA